MLWRGRFVMLKLFERLVFVAGHGQVNLARDIVPIERNPNVSVARPIGAAFIVLFYDRFEMKSVFTADVLDTKIVHDECECNGSCFMCPQARHKFRLKIASLVESFFKELIGN